MSARASTAVPLRVLLLVGSIRAGRFGHVPAAWAAERARERNDIALDVADLADIRLPVVLPGDDEHAPVANEVAMLGKRIQAADAVVIVTPVYNRGYPASLKNAIDWFHDEWAATPVGFVSYGGMSGGIEAVEQLRGVFAELRTMTIRNVLSFANFWERFDNGGQPVNADSARAAATAFFDQLLWWARALRSARWEAA
ncbi:NADPH-dependent FMN reductase [Hoyosella subflava]|uniref:NADPH-dependent FMN reductase n=1 Tax=Hoyosella subflava (strain DSM 45089 / JCM 17490 / NBRC 109087 / DQS3-9A1) TaxID=443218 RepID=F6EKI9_HOYSD|nr:NAD(P)H-dependent oxidoreductase [Hoyosella subflava]AEF39160.1 NADPH-dependent FMN reductase [Hoyosella subflava DQS3-9A1]